MPQTGNWLTENKEQSFDSCLDPLALLLWRFARLQELAVDWLETDWILAAFAERKQAAQTAYRRFVADGKNQASPWGDLKNQIYLGSDAFVDAMQRNIDADQRLSEIPKTQRRPVARPLTWYFKNTEIAILQFSKPLHVGVTICGRLATMLGYIIQGSAELLTSPRKHEARPDPIILPASTIVLFGPETPQLYGSLSPNAHILFSGLSCSPCVTAYNHRNSPCDGDNQCLKTISTEMVIKKARDVLAGARVLPGE